MKMKTTPVLNAENEKLVESLIHREQQERLSIASSTSEVLRKLSISIDNLPLRSQQLLHQAATAQTSSEIDQLDPVAISLQESRENADKLDDEYEILILRQKNEELQTKIDRNDRFLKQLREDLAYSRESLSKQSPNPDTIPEHFRQMRQKIVSYEETCEKLRTKFTKLSVPEHAMPNSLATLATSLAHSCEAAEALRRSAEDVALVRQTRSALYNLLKR